MKAIHSMIAALGLAFVLPAPADAGVNDPEVIIYRFPGVKDDGGAAHVGVATVFHCTNFSGDTQTLRLVTRGPSGTLLSNIATSNIHLATITYATHPAAANNVEVDLTTGSVGQGTTAIAATSINIICTAEKIDAADAKPVGVSLRGIRFNPAPGSQE